MMRRCRPPLAGLFLFLLSSAPAAAADAGAAPARLVTLGDSITDGGAYVLLYRQALAEAGKPAPAWINAGIGGDTAAGVRQRLDRDALSYAPDLVTFMIGTNDALRGVTPEAYETDVAATVEALKAKGVAVVLLTPPVLGPKHADAEAQRVDKYAEAVRRLAAKHGFPIADVNKAMRDARAAGRQVIEADDVHPNEDGHRLITRALLDATGHKDRPVPDVIKVGLLPGVVGRWKLRPAPAGQRINDHTATALLPDANGGWVDYSLPEQEPTELWWTEPERRRGVALSLEKRLGKADLYQGVAEVESAEVKKAHLNTGAALRAVWLNGKNVYRDDPAEWKGWHPGRDRIPVELKAGKNVIVIETGNQFFLSVTDGRVW